jgi:ribosomal protein S14
MLSLLQTSIKDKKQRLHYKSSELKRRYIIYLKRQATRLGVATLETLPRLYFKNYCLVSGRARSVYSRKFRLSRHQVKRYFEYIKGLRSSSW